MYAVPSLALAKRLSGRNSKVSLTQKTRNWIGKNANVSLKGKTAVVTGANSGVGYKTAETLLYLGANVILACRNLQKANAALESLASEYPESALSVIPMDLADFSSIDAFVDEIQEKGIDIDVFVNNAGCMHQPGKKTKGGFDLVIGTNYFGTYYLTEKLLPYLLSLPHQVIYVNTVSIMSRMASVDYEDFYCTRRKHSNMAKYGRSKLCLTKYSYHIAQKYKDTHVRIYMNHPGITITPLGLNAVAPGIARLARTSLSSIFNSNEKSALSVAYILSHSIPVGSIIGPGKGFGGWGYPTVNPLYKKYKTGAEELMAFTEKEIRK